MQRDIFNVSCLNSTSPLKIASATYDRGIIIVEADYSAKING
jgi:hypothetical protein